MLDAMELDTGFDDEAATEDDATMDDEATTEEDAALDDDATTEDNAALEDEATTADDAGREDETTKEEAALEDDAKTDGATDEATEVEQTKLTLLNCHPAVLVENVDQTTAVMALALAPVQDVHGTVTV
jgi:midasin (ATPase involved in ribosome maturation)